MTDKSTPETSRPAGGALADVGRAFESLRVGLGGPPAPAPPVQPAVGVLARLKLTEPVRLYLYSVALVLIAGLNLAGYLTGQWQDFAAASAATLLGIGVAGESARASVYSTRSVVQAVRRAGR